GLRLIDDTAAATEPLRNAFLWPSPRLALGQALSGVASSAIDISDGLLTDLGRLIEASGVGATVDLDRLPVSAAAVSLLGDETAMALACNGGDDYELCFTLPAADAAVIPGLVAQGGCELTIIGRITAGSALDCRLDGEPVAVPGTGRWSHFEGEQT
ncbi:MAG: AIR synthase-related protein, partial [Gammaproteobacteria bacterium]